MAEEQYETCPVCNGTTISPYEPGKKCSNCAWTGKVKVK